MFKAYALGWEVTEYGGAKIISHSGGVFGFITMVVLIPEKNVGFAITMNAEEGAVRRGLTNELIDHYLGRPFVDWVARYKTLLTSMLTNAKAAVEAKRRGACEDRSVVAARPLRRTATSIRGMVGSPWLAGAKGLTINFNETPRMSGPLEHYQYDTFHRALRRQGHRAGLRHIRS